MSGPVKLTGPQRDMLRRLADGWSHSRITNGTCSALEKKGLVEWEFEESRPWGGEWAITDAGRRALSEGGA